jgi:hypothetical protein
VTLIAEWDSRSRNSVPLHFEQKSNCPTRSQDKKQFANWMATFCLVVVERKASEPLVVVMGALQG